VPLLAVPNFSEGRDGARISAIETTLSRGVTLLDSHSDVEHNRSVFTIAGETGPLRDVLVSAAEEAIETLDMNGHEGVHPAIGALDVCPLVWLNPADRGAARTEAIEVAEQIGGLGVPVFLYGELATGPERVERAYFRNGGFGELWLRMEDGELRSDYGPSVPHRTAGATLVTARPPLAAFNIELDTGETEVSRTVAASLREAGGGLPGVRAIGLPLSSGRAQVSTNVHDPFAVPLGAVIERVRELAAPLGARPVEAELIGLIPEGALAGYPEDVPIRAFDPIRHVIERRLAAPTD
jgi:glutamate formiminotransferase / 5-formyltetrahydrofolate cyclo-ligase